MHNTTNVHAFPRNIVTMEFLQCDHRERKLKLVFLHTQCQSLGVQFQVLSYCRNFCTKK